MHRRTTWLTRSAHTLVAALGLVVGGCLMAIAPACSGSRQGVTAPDRPAIAFVSYRDGKRGEIYVMHADGSAQTNITHTPSADESHPAWSPDGAKIAFESAGHICVTELVLSNADGSTRMRLTSESDPFVQRTHPAWSPDGTRIAYQASGGSEYITSIWVMNADGSGQISLAGEPGCPGSAGDAAPAWSPDGTRIASESTHEGCGGERNWEIYVAELVSSNADGTGQIRLTDHPALDRSPAWSPDGTRIAFASHRDGNYNIYVMNADGTGLQRLTDNPAADESPAWSPDSTQIAFESNRDGNYEIYVMYADGSGQTRLTNHPANDRSPAWRTSDQVP
jgi:Tol biopolymer transport system component